MYTFAAYIVYSKHSDKIRCVGPNGWERGGSEVTPHRLSKGPHPALCRHYSTTTMDFSPNSFIDRPASDLPTPSLILSKPVLERNIQLLLQDVKQLGIAFRPHVKTLKVSPLDILDERLFNVYQSVEVTRMMLGNGIHRRIVASTLAEIRGALTLVKEGVLDEVPYTSITDTSHTNLGSAFTASQSTRAPFLN